MAMLTRDAWPKDGKNRSHIPRMPVWVAGLRIAQVVLSTVVVALTAWGLITMQKTTGSQRITSFSGAEGFPLSWFAFAWTLTYITWLGVAVTFIPTMYNSWVHLGLEIFSVIIWLVCLALFASHTDNLASIDAFASAFGTQYKALFNLDIKQYSQAFITATIAATAVTAVIFVLFLTSAIASSRELYRHRRGKVRGTDEAIGPESADRRKSSNPSAPDDDELGHRQQAPELQACEVLETQAPDPRYHTAELEDSRRRVELE